MADQTTCTPELLTYVRAVSLREDQILSELRTTTHSLPAGRAMQVMAEEGQLLALLVSLTQARSVLEIGTFTGYSTLCMARALPADGRLITCDISDRWPQIATPFWKRAEIAHLISVRIGPAAETLDRIRAEEGTNSFDFVFIDADKASYPAYYESCLTLVRPGGLIVVDNTLFFGRVIDPATEDLDAQAVHRLNCLLHTDERVDVSLIPMADGITLARKRPNPS
jgi:O-methyltransferase